MFAYLLSPKGRFRRTDWLLVFLGGSFISAIWGSAVNLLWNPIESLTQGPAPATFSEVLMAGLSHPTNWISIPLFIITFWAGIAATIKRYHDLDRSGWNALHNYFPVHIFVPAFILGMSIGGHVGVAIHVIAVLFWGWMYLRLAIVPGGMRDNNYGMSPYDGSGPEPRPVLFSLIALCAVSVTLAYLEYRANNDLAAKIQKDASTPEGAQALMEKLIGKNLVEKFQKMQSAATPSTTEQPEPAVTDSSASISAAEKGDAEAQYKLAFLYATGQQGLSQDINKTLFWLQRAALQGHTGAQHNLGVFYATGNDGAPVDYEEAYVWLSRAAIADYRDRDTIDYRAQVMGKISAKTREALDLRINDWKPIPEKR